MARGQDTAGFVNHGKQARLILRAVADTDNDFFIGSDLFFRMIPREGRCFCAQTLDNCPGEVSKVMANGLSQRTFGKHS